MYTYFLGFSEKDRSLLKESLQVEIFFIFLEKSKAEIDKISPNKLTIIRRLLTNIITTLVSRKLYTGTINYMVRVN